MWCIIIRSDDGNFDIIPTSWVIDATTCLYPNVGLNTVKRLSKEGAKPEANWSKIKMTIHRRNVDNYDRGLMDIIRLSKDKRTLTSSEEEEKGRGKRLKVRPAEEASEEEVIPDAPSTSAEFPTLHQRPEAVMERPSPSTTHLCLLKQRQTHFCVLKNKTSPDEVTNLDLARGMCHLSRSLNRLYNSSKSIQEELETLQKNMSSTAHAPVVEPTTSNIEFPAPLTSQDELLVMEERLKEEDFFRSCVASLSSMAEKSSIGRTVSSILKRTTSLELATTYTWKGQRRKDHKTAKGAFKDLSLAKLLIATTIKVWPGTDQSKISTVAASWLAQAASKIEKINKPSSAATGPNEEESL